MYELGSYVYLRHGAALYNKGTLEVIHATPADAPPVSIMGDIQHHNGQMYVPISNPFGGAVQDPVNPYRVIGEPNIVLVSTVDVRDPEEVTQAMLPAVAGGNFRYNARTGAFTKAQVLDAIDKGTWVALAATVGLTALLAMRNPKHKLEILTIGTGLAAGALYVNLNRSTWSA